MSNVYLLEWDSIDGRGVEGVYAQKHVADKKADALNSKTDGSVISYSVEEYEVREG